MDTSFRTGSPHCLLTVPAACRRRKPGNTAAAPPAPVTGGSRRGPGLPTPEAPETVPNLAYQPVIRNRRTPNCLMKKAPASCTGLANCSYASGRRTGR